MKFRQFTKRPAGGVPPASRSQRLRALAIGLSASLLPAMPAGAGLLPGLDPGSIPFVGTDLSLVGDPNDLYWDDVSKSLGIGTTTPNDPALFGNDISPITAVYNHDGGVYTNLFNESAGPNAYAEQVVWVPNISGGSRRYATFGVASANFVANPRFTGRAWFNWQSDDGAIIGGRPPLIFMDNGVLNEIARMDYTGFHIGSSPRFSAALGMKGKDSGEVTIKAQDSAGTYDFNLPTSAGAPGEMLTSQGGGTDAMIWSNPTESFTLACSTTHTQVVTAGRMKVIYRMPYPFTVTDVRASLTTAQVSGPTYTLDIRVDGASILGEKLTIDNGERTSVKARTPATLSTASLRDDAEMVVDVEQVGDGTARGCSIKVIGHRTSSTEVAGNR